LKKKKEQREEEKQKKNFDEFIDDDDEEEEQEESNKVSDKKKSHKNTKEGLYLKEDRDEEITDLLDPQAAKNYSSNPHSRKVFKGFPEADGKIIIENEEMQDDYQDAEHDTDNEDAAEDDKIVVEIPSSNFRGKRKRDNEKNSNSRPQGAKRLKRDRSEEPQNSGRSYSSKKAKGDMTKPGKHQPFAYIPLNPRNLNKRRQAKAAKQFKSFKPHKRKHQG